MRGIERMKSSRARLHACERAAVPSRILVIYLGVLLRMLRQQQHPQRSYIPVRQRVGLLFELDLHAFRRQLELQAARGAGEIDLHTVLILHCGDASATTNGCPGRCGSKAWWFCDRPRLIEGVATRSP